MIKIKKSPTADTRTCDWSKVTAGELLDASERHIADVYSGLVFFVGMLIAAADKHDKDKIGDIAGFHRDFQTGFKETAWLDHHRKITRHHINKPDGVPPDVNLVDVLELVVDCVMAGMGRSGSLYALDLPDEILQRALKNTVELLKENVVVEK